MKKILSLSFIVILLGLVLFLNNAKAAAPAAINDLACVKDINAGSIWIRWTPPVGVAAANAYELRYIQGNSIVYAGASIYTPSAGWASGTAGSVKQELATNFNVGTEFTFAMKVQNDLAEWSATSNVATCVAPRGTNLDSTAPITTINSPAYNASIAIAEGGINITGISKDSGGSSVQKIEVSLDNGVNWHAASVISNEEGNLIWQYRWASPSVGSYTIKARATDWMWNTEVSSVGIPIQVVSVVATPAPTTTPTITITPTTPTIVVTPSVGVALPYAAPVGATQIGANITYLQQQLVVLLQQLLALLQAQAGQ